MLILQTKTSIWPGQPKSMPHHILGQPNGAKSSFCAVSRWHMVLVWTTE
jgi:hypothetical protein